MPSVRSRRSRIFSWLTFFPRGVSSKFAQRSADPYDSAMQTIFSTVTKQIQQLASPTVTKHYKLEGTIGKGNFSVVKRATDRATGKEVAVKVISLDKFKHNEKAKNQIEREISIMKLVDHEHCVKLFNVFNSSNQVYLVLEIMTGGELFDRIISKEYYSESEAAKCFVQIMSAIEYLHSMSIVHRDIKPENVLYATPSDDSPVKLADFGFGKIVNFDGDVMSTMCGTPTFVAPEVIISKVRQGTGASYDKACDVWSAGVLLFCMLSGEHPFDQDARVSDLFRQITAGAYTFRPDIWCDISPEAQDLVRGMMTVDPKRRATAEACLAHAWCAGFREGRASSKALSHAQMKLRDRHEALARRKLLGAGGGVAAGGGGGGGAVGCLLARGEGLEIVSINAYGKQLLACAADPDPAPRFVRDLLDPGFAPTHARVMAKAVRDRSLPKSIQHPLRSVGVRRADGTTVQCELLVGKLDESQAFDDEGAVFFGYFVPTAESSAAGGAAAAQTLQEKMRATYGDGFAARLLSGEARPPPEHYDEVTIAILTVPPPVASEARLGEIAARHRVHKMRGDGGRLVCVAGTYHVAHDLAFDQTERIVAFVSEAVAALGDLRVSVGIATGPAAVAIEVLPPGSGNEGSEEELCRYTVSGPTVDAALRLERAGRPGFMHLSLAAADRLGAERGLFMDLAHTASAASTRTTPEGSSSDLDVGGGASAAAVAEPAAAGGLAAAAPPRLPQAPRRRSSSRSSSGSGRVLRHERSVWIDCFHAERAERGAHTPELEDPPSPIVPAPAPAPAPADAGIPSQSPA